MMKRIVKKKKLISFLLVMMMTCSLLPSLGEPLKAAALIDMEEGVTELTPQKSQLAFAGKGWWILGESGSNLTLFSVADAGRSSFRQGSLTPVGEATHYFPGINGSTDGTYYVHYGNTPFTHPSYYEGSSLENALSTFVADRIGSEKEQAMVAGVPVPLTKDEADGLTKGMRGSTDFWTRSAASDTEAGGPHSATFAWGANANGTKAGPVNFTSGVRPKLTLDSSEVFLSTPGAPEGASGAAGSKVSATIGAGLVETGTFGTAQSGDVVKFTVYNDEICLNVPKQTIASGNKLTVQYDTATIGTKQVLSCVLTQGDAVHYYGKLRELWGLGSESGTFDIPMRGVADGTYTLKIFNEEINMSNLSDFCSRPETLTLEVKDGIGTIASEEPAYAVTVNQGTSDKPT